MKYETYARHCRAQLVTPQDKAGWLQAVELNKPHTVDFTVTSDSAQLSPGNYRNHFGFNHELIRTEVVDTINP